MIIFRWHVQCTETMPTYGKPRMLVRWNILYERELMPSFNAGVVMWNHVIPYLKCSAAQIQLFVVGSKIP